MIKIIVDSTADFTLEEAKELGIKIVPLKTTVNNIEYKDRETLEPEMFYELLKDATEFPKTSQPSPAEWAHHYSDGVTNKDQLIVLTLSSEISGTSQSANLAKSIVGYDDIYVVDSRYATHGLRILTYKALQLIKEGKDFETVCSELEEYKSRITIMAIVDTLDYLIMGGRVSKLAGTVGSLLKLKPILIMTEGKGVIESLDKKRGTIKATERMIEIMKENGGMDLNEPIFIGYTGEPTLLDKFENTLKDAFYFANAERGIVGPVIGSHLGPGAKLITYVRKK